MQLLYAPIKVAICRKVGESLFGMQFLKCQQQLALATLEDPPQVIQRSILSAR
jgi:hypothetical protein